MKTTGVSGIPKFGLLDFLGHPTINIKSKWEEQPLYRKNLFCKLSWRSNTLKCFGKSWDFDPTGGVFSFQVVTIADIDAETRVNDSWCRFGS